MPLRLGRARLGCCSRIDQVQGKTSGRDLIRRQQSCQHKRQGVREVCLQLDQRDT